MQSVTNNDHEKCGSAFRPAGQLSGLLHAVTGRPAEKEHARKNGLPGAACRPYCSGNSGYTADVFGFTVSS